MTLGQTYNGDRILPLPEQSPQILSAKCLGTDRFTVKQDGHENMTGIGIDEIRRISGIVRPIASKRGGFEKIYLFGSRARGDGTEKSDYDFCVYPDDDVSIIKLAGLMNDLAAGLGSKVDIVDATALKVGDAFINEIERDGILVYERRSAPAPPYVHK